jgi:hypothetical protein
MIREPKTLYTVDERATKRAKRLVLALNDLERRGLKETKRYAKLKRELDGIMAGRKKKPGGVIINVPRI